MIRKDYKAIAEAIRAELDYHSKSHQAERYTCHAIANRIADALAADNPRFDRSRFMEACGFAD